MKFFIKLSKFVTETYYVFEESLWCLKHTQVLHQFKTFEGGKEVSGVFDKA